MARRAKATGGDGTPVAKAAKPAGTRRKPVAKPNYTAPALEKGLDVLELLATLTVPVTPSQIAQRLGRSVQEVYRMVVTLERRGYLIRPPGEEALVLSTQLYGLATLFPPFRRVVDAAQPIMNALALETSQAIHMAVLDGLNQRIIAQVDSPAPIAIRLRVGAASPAIRGTSGRTIVAFQPPPVREWILNQSEAIVPPEQVARLRLRIAAIASRGYERIEGEVVQGVTDLSFPIMNAAGFSIAALTMPFLTSQQVIVPFDDAAAILFGAARRISETMGGQLPEPQFPLPLDAPPA